MTTKLPYTMLPYDRQGEIDYASLDFNPDEPEPLPDAMIQNPQIFEIMTILAARFDRRRRPDVFIDSNTFICYDRRNLNVRVGPDCYVAFGVDSRSIRQRRIYLPWEAGKPPDFALEIASETTARHDVSGKRRIYAEVGVPEYWRFDPSGCELYGDPLVGERLAEGAYTPIDLTTEPDGVLKGYSPSLALSLCWYEGWLYLYDPVTGEYLRNIIQLQDDLLAAQDALEAEQAALEAERAALQAERAAREAKRDALQAERAAREAEQIAREAAEARVRQLEEELRRRPPEG